MLDVDDTFCAVCRNVIPHYLGRELSFSYTIGRLKAFRRRQHCPRCRFVARCLSDRTDVQVHDEDMPSQCHKETTPDQTCWADSQITIKLWFSGIHGLLMITADPPASLLLQVSLERTAHERLLGSQIDFAVARNWLSECLNPEGEHESCNQDHLGETRADLRELQLVFIDVERRVLVRPDTFVPYITLSYVWGALQQDYSETVPKSSLEEDIKTDSTVLDNQPTRLINQTLPQTLLDAIHFTKGIGQRFIWIDALCTPQHEPATRTRQIKGMDLIFLNSLCTLIALTGLDASSGMPGVSPRSPRTLKYNIERLLPNSNHSWLAGPEPLGSILKRSHWGTRAWTLQEGLLTMRRFVISSEQMYFVCRKGCRPEYRFLGNDDNSELDAFDVNRIRLQSDDPRTLHWLYNGLLESYTARNLSHAEDCLRAFKGILSWLERRNEKLVSFGGLLCDDFGVCMLWEEAVEAANGYERPRDWQTVNWPSWSWIGHWTPIKRYNIGGLSEQSWDYFRLSQSSFAVYEAGVGSTSLEDWVSNKRAQDGRRGIRHNQLGEARLVIECMAVSSCGENWHLAEEESKIAAVLAGGLAYQHHKWSAHVQLDRFHFGDELQIGSHDALYLLAVSPAFRLLQTADVSTTESTEPGLDGLQIKLLAVTTGLGGYAERIGVAWMRADQFVDEAEHTVFRFDDPLHAPRHVARMQNHQK